jgi:hypothetical protein
MHKALNMSGVLEVSGNIHFDPLTLKITQRILKKLVCIIFLF